jgi:hypothetical protein
MPAQIAYFLTYGKYFMSYGNENSENITLLLKSTRSGALLLEPPNKSAHSSAHSCVETFVGIGT